MAEMIQLDHPGSDVADAEAFLLEALQILLDEGVRKGTDATQKVCEWKEPEELRELLGLELRDHGESRQSLLRRCRLVLRYSVKTGHPRFFNQLFSGLDLFALTGRFITETLNTSQATYEIAPVFVLMEEVLLAKLREMVGWSDGDGIFAPGGRWSPRSWRRRSRGRKPSGTTVLGAFDPLGAIADICQRHNLWLHVDAAWGGSALLSGKHRHLLDGIERADSVAWNPHKMLTVGQQCSAFLLRDSSGLLQRCHGTGATYLFQRDKFYDVTYDTGDKTPQCGRRVDCLKLWLLWKAIGTQGLARRVERAFAFTRYLAEEMKRRDGFRLVLEPEFINLCFWFVPPSLRGREDDPQYWSKLGKVAPVIKERMMKKGSMLVGYQPHGPHVNFFRQVVTNPVVTRADLDFFLDEIERLGEDLGGTPHPPPHPEPSSDP
ncbi:cysteine sulfinic acid decarboxylase isoform X4 [Cuculus canorus]|uniref:cysteine sulfinic acid decarboxylase isoform X4 n=1 Tax=Cuculus canorus TaxID=55661 RepID=UPI0023AB0143|nr:cysteine sulfinic acid decarboxylase isoform X4 [Cuculus canorus]